MANEYFKWTDNLSVGHLTIDEQHKVLIGILNRAYSAYLEKKPDAEIREILKELTKYTLFHFSTEEKLFAEMNYKEAALHEAEHRSFVENLNSFKETIESNPTLAVIKISTFVQKWLREHIMISDKKYMEMFSK